MLLHIQLYFTIIWLHKIKSKTYYYKHVVDGYVSPAPAPAGGKGAWSPGRLWHLEFDTRYVPPKTLFAPHTC